MSSFSDHVDNLRQQAAEAKEQRTDEIKQDIKDVLNDDSVFGQLIADSVGEVLGEAFSALEDKIGSAVKNALTSDAFTERMAEQMDEKTVERAQPSFDKDIPY